MVELTGAVQHYAWGSTSALPHLIQREPDGRPWAEMWFGTHPAAPTFTVDGDMLLDVSGPLTYLVKLLGAGSPLSLQTHPDSVQAAAGYAAGVFGDPFAKPEIMIALTSLEAVCGFRPFDETRALMASWGIEADGLSDFDGAAQFAYIMRHGVPSSVFGQLAGVDHPSARWACTLASMYPGDPAAAATLLLNHVVLEPGEAIYLGAGNLHAYLHGAGVEVMGASDNVVRGGLTVKPVDVDLLLATVRVEPLAEPRAACVNGWYETPDAPFTVHMNPHATGDFRATYDAGRITLRLSNATFTASPATRP